MDIGALLSIGFAFFVVAVSPGPATLSNAVLAMSQGRKVSLIYGMGLSSGLVVWGGVAATGLVTLLQSSIYILMTIKVLGGLYLLWLAYVSGKAALRSGHMPKNTDNSQKAAHIWFLKGLLLNVSNPKTVIAWVAALSIGIAPDANASVLLAGVVVCTIVGFLTNALYSVLFSFNRVMGFYNRFRQWIDAVASGLFSIAGVGLMRSAFER